MGVYKMNTITGKVEITVEEFERLRDIERNTGKYIVYRHDMYAAYVTITFSEESEVINLIKKDYEDRLESNFNHNSSEREILKERIMELTARCKELLDENTRLKQTKSIFFWRNK